MWGREWSGLELGFVRCELIVSSSQTSTRLIISLGETVVAQSSSESARQSDTMDGTPSNRSGRDGHGQRGWDSQSLETVVKSSDL